MRRHDSLNILLAKHQSKAVAAILLGAFMLYVMCRSYFDVGYFIDDALYVVLAKALSGGSYATIFSPQPQAVTEPLPGYPLFLMPWVALFGFQLSWLKLTSVISIIAGSYITMRLAKKCNFNAADQMAVAALCCFSPTIVRYSSAVMSEPAFIVVSALALYSYNRDRIKTDVVCGLLLGWGCLIRPHGVFLLIAAVLVLLALRKFRTAVLMFLGSAIPILTVVIRNVVTSHQATGYVSTLLYEMQNNLSLATYFSNLKIMLGVAFPGVFFNAPQFSHFYWQRLVGVGLIGLGLLVMGYGFVREQSRPLLRVAGYFCAGVFLALPIWHAEEARYMLPLVPFMALLFVGGVRRLINRFAIRWAFPPLILMFLFFYGQENINTVRVSAQPQNDLPAHTFEWIHQNIPSDERLMSELAPVVYLYTNRLTSLYLWSESEQEFVRQLRGNRITNILYSDGRMVGHNSRFSVLHSRIGAWVRNDHTFRLIYNNEQERTRIYRLLEPSNR